MSPLGTVSFIKPELQHLTGRLLACAVLKPGKSAAFDELRAHLSANFVEGQLPDRFEFPVAIPRTSTGKFWKVKLRERFAVKQGRV